MLNSFFQWLKHNETEAKLDDQQLNEKEKRSMLHRTRTTQTRKRANSRKAKTKQRRKKPIPPRVMKMGGYRKVCDEKRMYFRGRGSRQSWSLLNTVWHISNGYRNEWTSRYATQKGCNFETMEDEMKAFHGINFHFWKSIGNRQIYWKLKDLKRHDKNKVSVHLTKSSLF